MKKKLGAATDRDHIALAKRSHEYMDIMRKKKWERSLTAITWEYAGRSQ